MIQLAIKDLKLFFKDRRLMFLTFAIPIALITLFAFALGGIGKKSNDRKITLLVSDLDNTPISINAIKQFDSLHSVQIEHLSLEKAENAIKNGNKSCVLVIHKGFSDSIISGMELPIELRYDEAKELEVGLLQQSLIPTLAMLPFNLNNSKSTIGNKLIKISGVSDLEAKEAIKRQSDKLFDIISLGISEKENGAISNTSANLMNVDIKLTKIVKAKNNNQLGLIQAVAGTAVMMLLFSVAGIGMGLLEEKQEGTLKRLLYSPMNPLNIIWGKMISANVISIMQLIVMFLFASLAFKLDIGSHLLGLLITIIATSFACSAFGVFLASFAKNRQQVQGLSTLVILVMSAIGGSMIPLLFMPVIMQKVAVVSVNYWSIQAFYDVLWRNLPITSYIFLSRILVLSLIGVILNTIAVLMFKRNILKV